MKNLLKFILLLFIVFACKTDDKKYNKVVTEKIQYDISVKNNETDLDWWIQNIEGPKRDKFVNLIFSAIKDNKLKIFDLNEKSVTLESVLSNLFAFDTIQLQNNAGKNQIIDTVLITNSFDYNKITQFRFREKWTFNEKTLMVDKKINGFCPVMVTEREGNESQLVLPLFWIFPDTTQKPDENNLIQITQKIQYDVFIKSDDAKNTWFVNNIETSDREFFVNKIIEVASKGKLKTYDFFDQPLDKKKFKLLLHKSDTTLVEDPDNPGVFTSKVIKTDLDPKSITKIRFIEEWRIDKQSFQFFKTVKAISLLMEVKDENGDIRGYTPVFWIYFDENIKNIAAN